MVSSVPPILLVFFVSLILFVSVLSVPIILVSFLFSASFSWSGSLLILGFSLQSVPFLLPSGLLFSQSHITKSPTESSWPPFQQSATYIWYKISTSLKIDEHSSAREFSLVGIFVGMVEILLILKFNECVSSGVALQVASKMNTFY